MNNSLSRSILLFLVWLLFYSQPAFAQEKQGNIVEYFGKEKVTDVHEGKVTHTFTEGLILGGNRFSLNSESTPQDPLVASLLLNEAFTIKEGDEAGMSRRGEPQKWEAVKVGEKNEFSDRRLRSGYLYLEYEAEHDGIHVLDASGHTKLFVNGMPREGDHYDYGWSLIPVQLKAGKNTFLLTGGRFPRMRARLLAPENPVQLTPRDKTLPDLLKEEEADALGGIRVLNSSKAWFEGEIVCEFSGKERSVSTGTIGPLTSRKVPFQIPSPGNAGTEEKLAASVKLKDMKGAVISSLEIELRVRSNHEHHNRTFLSDIDGSVQYFGVAPCSDPKIEKPAMFLSVHGASVEASGQARAYKQKDWGHLVAPTNRRAFGFAWEDWGRLDAMEVLDHAENLFKTDRQRTYLTGHSMGGHGTWYLGATYPDRFAAIGPAAGYPDLLAYRGSFRRRLENASDEDLKRFGMTRERASQMLKQMEAGPSHPAMDAMIRRAGNPSRTLKLKRNYLHHGVYVLHGEKDTVVPTFLAREMREVLATFHPDFCYYEYPGGTHWYGNHSVDWKPLFDFFEFRQIKPPEEIDDFEFYTASPGVSASSHFLTILQQKKPFEISSIHFEREETPGIVTSNVAALSIDLKKMGGANSIRVNEQAIDTDGRDHILLRQINDRWEFVEAIGKSEKGPHRNGGFKDAFKNRMVLVYATKGSEDENDWYYNRARHDAETFYYRANGNVELIKDTDFKGSLYQDRNVVVYGNRDNNAAWEGLLNECPVQVSEGELRLGDRILTGDQHGAFFIYPRKDSEIASIGVVTATGVRGMKAAYANWYLLNGTTFPDVMIFDQSVLQDGLAGVTASGFFGNDWSVSSGDWVWRSE